LNPNLIIGADQLTDRIKFLKKDIRSSSQLKKKLTINTEMGKNEKIQF
jgi:hypothetical protein